MQGKNRLVVFIFLYLVLLSFDGLGYNVPLFSLFICLPAVFFSFLKGNLRKEHFYTFLFLCVIGSSLLIINNHTQILTAKKRAQIIAKEVKEYEKKNDQPPARLTDIKLQESSLFFRKGLFQFKQQFAYSTTNEPHIAFSVSFFNIYYLDIKTEKWKKVGFLGM
jgi:hypothetical protein